MQEHPLDLITLGEKTKTLDAMHKSPDYSRLVAYRYNSLCCPLSFLVLYSEKRKQKRIKKNKTDGD